jgi:DNA-binding beta-propeller fold protein YncE
MRRLFLLIAIGIVTSVSVGLAIQAPADEPSDPPAQPYKVLKIAKVGGAGNFDYVYADVDGRRLYIPRTGTDPRITVFDLDTLQPVGSIPNVSARGAAVDPKSNHGFASSKPVVMWDTKSLAVIKNIDVQGNPDGILFDAFNERVYVFSHTAPNATVINATDGSVAGTIDLGGMPEQAVTDGEGHLYVDLEDKNNIAVVDAKAMKVTGHYDLAGKCGAPAGLGFDNKYHILFASCANPAAMAILKAEDGEILTALPIGAGTDGAIFNAATLEAFSSQRDGTLTIIKERSRHVYSASSFTVQQNLKTMPGAKTLTLDTKTNRILLISAEYGQPATPPAGGRGGRGQMVQDSFSIIVVGK